jgi:hypothetical protein
MWMDSLIGVMSKRSVSLAAAGDAGRFECDVQSICRGAVEDDLFSLLASLGFLAFLLNR